jgi:hypothetical protein
MSNKIKKLTLEYSYLSLEYSDIKLACDSVENDIRSRIQKTYPKAHRTIFSTLEKTINTSKETNDKETNDKETNDKETNDKETNDKNIKNKDLRKLYRKIAAKTHPDKNNDEKKSNIFPQAAKAYQDNDLGKLIELSYDAQIEDFELSKESILLLEKNIVLIKKKIDILKSSAAWSWHNSESDKQKDKIVENIIISKGIKLK